MKLDPNTKMLLALLVVVLLAVYVTQLRQLAAAAGRKKPNPIGFTATPFAVL